MPDGPVENVDDDIIAEDPDVAFEAAVRSAATSGADGLRCLQKGRTISQVA